MRSTVRKFLLAGAVLTIPAALQGEPAYPYKIIPGYGWFGLDNSGQFNGVLAVGKNNALALPNVSDTGSAAIGSNIRVEWPNCVAAGRNNSFAITGSAPRFIVGNGLGTGSGDRSNALEVRQDGTVHIRRVPPRGGISMGSFTAPPSTHPPEA